MSDETLLARTDTGETDGAPRMLRDERGRFIVGTAPGPGRCPDGRRAAIQVLDRLMADAGNLEKLRDALQDEFTRSPIKFFRSIIMPLLPKQALLGIQTSDGMQAAVKIITGVSEDRL